MAKSIGTSLVVRHFPDRAKPCLCIEQGNQAMILATFRNKECEDLYKEFLQGYGISRKMRPIFEQENADDRLLNSDWGDMEVRE